MTEQNRTGAMVVDAPDELEQEPNAQVQPADHDGTTNGTETPPVAVVAGQSAAHEPAATMHGADEQPAPADDPIAQPAAVSASAGVDTTSAPETAQDAQDSTVEHSLTFHAETEAVADTVALANTMTTADIAPAATDAAATDTANAADAAAADATANTADTAPAATDTAADAAIAAADTANAAAAADTANAVAAATTTEQASAAIASVTDAVPAEATVAGASFTPVEETKDRPRRLKDLTVGMELTGKITSIALYGVFVDIGVGRDGLLHISEMSEGRVTSPSELVQIGEAVQVRVKSIDLEARRIGLTMRPERPPEERRRGKPRAEVNREALATLKVHDTIEGTITGLSSFGAFVDIGVGKDGLVHVSELSESRVEKPEDVVQVGQKYLFKLLEIDPDGSRISLSLRKAQRAQKMRELEPGQTFEGVVSGIAPFGAFIDIGVGRDGLVHISQIAEERVNRVEDKLKVGDKVSVRVLEVDPQSKRISLTMRPERTPEEQAEIETRLNPPAEPPAPPPNRFTLSQEQREEARQREQQSRRRTQQRTPRVSDPPPAPSQTDVVYATPDDPEEGFEGNATLDDLLSKFGGANRRDRRRPEPDEDGDEDETGHEQRQRQRQREAIRRTLQQDDER